MAEEPTLDPENQEQQPLDPRVESLAIPLARDYAEKNYPLQENGAFKPAWRGINGEKEYKGKSPDDLVAEGWTPEAAATVVIDIANTPYDQFSEHWKAQNRGGAETLIGLVDTRGADVIAALDVNDPVVRSEVGGIIHDAWIARMGGAESLQSWAPDQAVPFNELSPEEAQKDIDQVVVLQKWLAEQPQV